MKMSQRDGEYLWKQWRDQLGDKVEDTALRLIAAKSTGFAVEEWMSVVCAVRDAILESWMAGWKAAGGDDDETE